MKYVKVLRASTKRALPHEGHPLPENDDGTQELRMDPISSTRNESGDFAWEAPPAIQRRAVTSRSRAFATGTFSEFAVYISATRVEVNDRLSIANS